VHVKTNSDTLGEASNICNMMSTYILGRDHPSHKISREKQKVP
jgi:hypothetical protein